MLLFFCSIVLLFSISVFSCTGATVHVFGILFYLVFCILSEHLCPVLAHTCFFPNAFVLLFFCLALACVHVHMYIFGILFYFGILHSLRAHMFCACTYLFYYTTTHKMLSTFSRLVSVSKLTSYCKSALNYLSNCI